MSEWRIEPCLLDHPHPPPKSDEPDAFRACIGMPSPTLVEQLLADLKDAKEKR